MLILEMNVRMNGERDGVLPHAFMLHLRQPNQERKKQ